MFFTRQAKPQQNERQQVMGPTPETFLPPVQAPDQPDDDYRLVLIDQIAEIDKTKRDIKRQIHSNAITAKAERISVDQVWLRRAKDKIDHLTREREEVRKALHTVNERIKDQRRAEHIEPKRDIAKVFMQVARERLPPDVYEGILDAAAGRAKSVADSPEPCP